VTLPASVLVELGEGDRVAADGPLLALCGLELRKRLAARPRRTNLAI
jgi:hypothetical protein